MSINAAYNIPAIVNYTRQAYGAKVFSKHLLFRTYERFTPDERAVIFSEIRELTKSGMHRYLFKAKEAKAHVILKNNIEVIFELSGTGLLRANTAFRVTNTRAKKHNH